jgi:hypothetical protein
MVGLCNRTARVISRVSVLALVMASVVIAGPEPTVEAAAVPGAPVIVDWLEGDGALTVWWAAPADNGAAIAEYRVYMNDGVDYTAVVGTPPATSLHVAGLTNGATYTFRVSAVNASGEGPTSTPSIPLRPFGLTMTNLAASPTSPIYGNAFDVVVTVSGSAIVTDGNVTLYRGSSEPDTKPVVNGTATWTGEAPNAGNQSYRADYRGAPGWISSTSGLVRVTIARAAQTITFDAPADTAFTEHTLDLSPTATSGAVVAVSSISLSVCTVAGLTVTLITGGTCTLAASQQGDLNHLAAEPVSRSFDVTGAPQTITFPRPADRTRSATTFDLTTSASTAQAVTLSSDTTDVCTVAGPTVTMVRTGTCRLTAAQAGTTHFAAASFQQSFEVTGAGQGTLAAGVDSHALIIGDSTNVASSGGSGTGDVTFAVTSGTAHCSLAGTVLVATGVGTCVVTATKHADVRYAASSDDTATITVGKLSVTATVSGASIVQSRHRTTVTVNVGSLRNGVSAGQISLQLSGATTGVTFTPAMADLTLAADGMSGTTAFTITAGEMGVLSVSARMAGTAVYEEATAPAPLGVVVTQVPAVLTAVTPTRVIDTRPGYQHLLSAPDAQVAAGEVLEVKFTDLPGLIPGGGVSAVVLEIGVVAPDGDGYVTAYPCGVRPVASNVNYRSGQTVTNAAVAPVNDATGSVCFYANRTTHIIVDVTGWVSANEGFADVAPTRVVDTRPEHDALRVLTGAFAAGEVREVQVTDLPGLVPAIGVGAVVLNVTVVQPDAAGFVSAYACGDRPNASTVNFTAGRAVANLALVPIDASTGSLCFYASQSLHLVVDINGWFEVDHGFSPVGPDRVFDTRSDHSGLVAMTGTRLDGDQFLTVKVTDLAGLVPISGVGAVSLNVTAIDPAADGFITVYACGSRPNASSVNYAAHRTVANAVIAPVDPATGNVCFFSNQPVHLAVDLNGWFLASAT